MDKLRVIGGFSCIMGGLEQSKAIKAVFLWGRQRNHRNR